MLSRAGPAAPCDSVDLDHGEKLSNELRIIPLGGLGEFGMNMMAIESGSDLIVVDAGTLFPGPERPGIDVIVPDLAYLLSRKENLRGLVLTHAHQDHIGAVAHVLSRLDVPVYGTAFTLGLVRKQLSGFSFHKPPHLVTIKPGESLVLGRFTVEGIHVTHSTVQCMALAISTPAGYVLHTGDFKIDQTPIDGRKFDFAKFAEYGDRGVLLLCSDSTNSDVPGFCKSERAVTTALDRIFSGAEEALFFTCFSSAIHRVQQIVDQAVEHRRKVALVGRSLSTACDIAANLGLLRMPPGTMVRPHDLRTYPRRDRVTIIAGSQGEPMSSLSRAARGRHKTVEIEEGDVVAFSAKMIPGNEARIYRMVDHLYRQGASVLYGGNCPDLHVSGHPCQEELKLVLNLVRPRYFLPVHGDYRQLAQHRRMATEVRGRELEESWVLENGQILQFDEFGARVLPDKATVGHCLIDAGTGEEVLGDAVMWDRRRLANFGVLVPVVTIDERKGEATDVEIISRGFVGSEDAKALLDETTSAIHTAIAKSTRAELRNLEVIEDRIRNRVQRHVARKTARRSRPLVVPVVLDA